MDDLGILHYRNTYIEAILERENMNQAWEQVRSKKGAPGLDGVTLARWERNWEANIERLREQVRTNTYRPSKPKRIAVRKKNGGTREISLLCVSDKVLQRAVINVIEPAFEKRFLGCSHGYRRNRSTATAVQQVLNYRDKGLKWVVDADVEACFDNIDHAILMRLVSRVVKDWFVLNLMNLWLSAGRKYRHQAIGIPQGAVVAPLWCNIYLHQLDANLSCAGWKLVRYADDFVIMTASQEEAQTAYQACEAALLKLKLRYHPGKTRITDFESGFRFLGVDFLGEAYAYDWEKKRISVQGKNLKILYRHVPYFY